MPTLDLLVHGRVEPTRLEGPLAHLGLGRDGTYYVVAAGKCNHAGPGIWKGISGNDRFIGIEAENTGEPSDTWPDVQIDAYRRGVAAILKHLGRGVEVCCGHKEYAPSRKSDPSFDMDEFRAAVDVILAGTAPTPTLMPAVEAVVLAHVPAPRKTLRRGVIGALVQLVQRKVGRLSPGQRHEAGGN